MSAGTANASGKVRPCGRLRANSDRRLTAASSVESSSSAKNELPRKAVARTIIAAGIVVRQSASAMVPSTAVPVRDKQTDAAASATSQGAYSADGQRPARFAYIATMPVPIKAKAKIFHARLPAPHSKTGRNTSSHSAGMYISRAIPAMQPWHPGFRNPKILKSAPATAKENAHSVGLFGGKSGKPWNSQMATSQPATGAVAIIASARPRRRGNIADREIAAATATPGATACHGTSRGSKIKPRRPLAIRQAQA